MKNFTGLGHRSRRAWCAPVPAAAYIGRPLLLERKLALFPKDERKRVERKYLRFAGVGIQFALTILLLTFLGIWLDGRFGTGALFTVVLLLLGFAGATWSLVHHVLGAEKPDKKE